MILIDAYRYIEQTRKSIEFIRNHFPVDDLTRETISSMEFAIMNIRDYAGKEKGVYWVPDKETEQEICKITRDMAEALKRFQELEDEIKALRKKLDEEAT